MSNFPEEMLQEIFIRLPVKSLCRFKCVSKALFSLIRSRSFTNMHHNLKSNIENNASLLFWKNECMYSADYNSLSSLLPLSKPITVNRIDYPFKLQPHYAVDIIYYCDGLVCVCCSNGSLRGDHYKDEIHLWNPSTNEYMKIPAGPQGFFGKLDLGAYGFGYDNNSDTYKLVRVIDFRVSLDSAKVDIYTLGLNSWKSIQSIPYRFDYEYAYNQGVLYNGALHWHARTIGEHSKVLIAFDIANESFREVAQPKEPLEENKYADVCTRVLGGCLCVLFLFHNVGIDVWMMQDYGVRESWTKSFSIAQESVHQVPIDFHSASFWNSKNNEIIIKGNSSLFIYDMENKRYKELLLPYMLKGTLTVLGNHIPSLVSLDH